MTTPYQQHHYVKEISLRLARAGGAFALIFLLGYIVFARYVLSMSPPDALKADGIVVLTGDEDRISEGLKLLADGRAGRLLISGVHRHTTMVALISLNAPYRAAASSLKCCIDLGKRASNTESNAQEATAWANRHGYRSLIVVTSNYHMPRALLELRQAMPRVALVPYPVAAPAFIDEHWWQKRHSLKLLAKEYVKFSAALVRYLAFHLVGPSEGNATAKRTVDASLP